MPRDRDGTFEPKTVRKYQRRLHGVDAMVISLTAKGLTTGEVQAHLAEVYGTDLSRETMGLTSGDAARIKDLEAEVRELRRANEILRPGGCRTNPAYPAGGRCGAGRFGDVVQLRTRGS